MNLKFATVRLPASARDAWLILAILVTLVLIVVGLVFPEESSSAFTVWTESRTYNHCFLILPIALYMTWTRRDRFVGGSVQPTILPGLAVAALSLVWTATALFGVMEAQQFVVLAIAQCVLLGALGAPLYRRLVAPLLYLFFLVPSGDFLTGPLLDFTASFTVHGLQLVHIPVYSNGAIIEVRSGTFAVEEACAGLRFLIATVALGVFYACEIYTHMWKRCIFIALCIVVPVVANGLRAFGLIVASELIGNAAAVESDHITYGLVFFSLVLAILIFVGRIFADLPPVELAPEPIEIAGSKDWRRNGSRLGFAAIACLAFVLVGLVASELLNRPVPSSMPSAPPKLARNWSVVPEEGPLWRPKIFGAHRSFFDARSDGQATVYRFVGLFPIAAGSEKMARSNDRVFDEKYWQYSSHRPVVLHFGGQAVPINATVISGGERRRLVVTFYVVDGVVTANLWQVKFREFAARFSHASCPSALFVLATDQTDDRSSVSALQTYVNVMATLPAYLCRR